MFFDLFFYCVTLKTIYSDSVSFISSVKNSPANAVKISAVILNLASDKPDSDKPEKINISDHKT